MRTNPLRPLAWLALVTLAACAAPADHHARPAGSAATVASPAAPADPVAGTVVPTAPPTVAPVTTAPAPVPFPVGTHRFDIRDDNRGRLLSTLVTYPATRPGVDAAPRPEPAPLVLLAHGYRLPADGYQRIVETIASNGYVVAAVDFPRTSSNGGDGNRADIVNQPADLTAVLDAVVAAPPPIPPIATPDRVAVIGHSDGGLTASAWALNPAYRDSRVRALVELTGGRALFPGGYRVPDPPPVLAVHGTADGNPFSASERLVADQLPGVPGYLVAIAGGAHIEPFMFGTGMTEIGELIVAFLDAHLGSSADAEAVARLRALASVPPLELRIG